MTANDIVLALEAANVDKICVIEMPYYNARKERRCDFFTLSPHGELETVHYEIKVTRSG